MGSESIDFIQEMNMLVSGPMGSAMVVVCIPLRMEVDMSGSLNGVPNMALVVTISGESISIFFFLHSFVFLLHWLLPCTVI